MVQYVLSLNNSCKRIDLMKISLRSILIIIVMSAIIFTFSPIFFFNLSELFSIENIIVLIGTEIVMLVFLIMSSNRLLPLMGTVIITSLVFYVHRALSIMVLLPDSYRYLETYPIDPNGYTYTLIYLFFAILAICTGLLMGDVVGTGKIKKIDWKKVRSPLDFNTYLLIGFILLFFKVILLYYDIPENIGFLVRFLDMMPILIILILSFVISFVIDRTHKKYALYSFYLFLAFYLLFKTSTGSRAGLLEIILFFILSIILINQIYIIKTWRFIAISVVIVISGIMLFVVSSAVKIMGISTNALEQIMDLGMTDFFETVRISSIEIYGNVLTSLTRRLGYVDNLYLVTNILPDGAVLNQLNLVNAFKILFDEMIPGEISGLTRTSLLFDSAYFGKPISDARLLYHTDTWTIGVFKLYFGYIEGIFVLLCLFAMIAIVYNHSSILFGRYGIFFKVYWLMFSYNTVQMFGIDQIMIDAIRPLAVAAIIIFIVEITKRGWRDFKHKVFQLDEINRN